MSKILRYTYSLLVLIGGVLAPSSVSATTSELQFRDRVVQAAQACIKRKRDSPAVCWVKASPEKCKSFAYKIVEDPLPWAICVRSCASENIFTKQFGECRREI
jgi:hypothetical protein